MVANNDVPMNTICCHSATVFLGTINKKEEGGGGRGEKKKRGRRKERGGKEGKECLRKFKDILEYIKMTIKMKICTFFFDPNLFFSKSESYVGITFECNTNLNLKKLTENVEAQMFLHSIWLITATYSLTPFFSQCFDFLLLNTQRIVKLLLRVLLIFTGILAISSLHLMKRCMIF